MIRKLNFVTDPSGKQIGVMLDLRSYQSLLQSTEELKELREYDRAREKVYAEIARGEFTTIEELKKELSKKKRS
jgi:hypothetical protein